MVSGATYEETRIRLRLSRPRVTALSKRAGHTVTVSCLKRLEVEGSALAGSRGYPATTVAWLDCLYGLSDPTEVDWSEVERGAPVLVLGEKPLYSFHAIDDADITVWGGTRNRETFRTVALSIVRLVATTATPPSEDAHLYQSPTRGVDTAYGRRILAHMRAHPGPHAVGVMAYNLGIDNMAVSRVAAALVKRGELHKLQRGVYALTVDPDPATIKSALAERVMEMGR